MMPRLEAEAQLAAYEATALGMGNFERADARERLRRLHERMRGDGLPQRGRRASSAELGQIGIGVRVVPPQKAVNDA